MGIESVISKSWGEFKKSIKLSLKISLWFLIIPLLVCFLILLIFIIPYLSNVDLASFQNFSNQSFNQEYKGDITYKSFLVFTGKSINCLSENSSDLNCSFLDESEIPKTNNYIPIFIIMFIFIILPILYLFLFLTSIIIFYNAINNEKGIMKFKEAVKGGLSYFWRFIGIILIILFIYFGVLIVGFLLGLIIYFLKLPILVNVLFYIFLIILGFIIMFYYFVNIFFAPFILVKENKGVFESISLSFKLVKNRWWKSFGLILLFTLILYPVMIVTGILFNIPFYLFYILLLISFYAGSVSLLISLIVIFGIILLVLFGVVNAINYTAMTLIYKNLYLELKNNKI